MVPLPLNLSIEQASLELSQILHDTQSLTPECQEKIVSEIHLFTNQLHQLIHTNGSAQPAGDSARQQPEEKDAGDMFLEHVNRVGMVLRGAKAGLFVRDIVKNTSAWSAELRDLLGVPANETSGPAQFMEMVHPEDQARVKEATQAAICKGGPFYQEFRLVRPDGETIWLSSVGFVEQDPDGRPLSITGINQDITARKNAEAALQESQERLRESENQARQRLAEIEAIYQNAPVGLCVFDNQLRWVRVNQRIAEINGVPPEAHIGKTPREVVPDVGEQAEEAIRTIFETGQPLLDFEMRGTTAAQPGVERFWNERWTPIKDETGAVTGISVAAEEITERKRAEEALKAEHEHITWLARIPAENPGPVIRATLDGVTKYCNRAAEEIPGWAIKQGEPMPEVMRSLLEQAKSEGKKLEKDIQVGSKFYSIAVTPFLEEQYANIYAMDITERKRVEEALQASEAVFARAFRSSPVAMAITRASNGRYLDTNDSHEALMGYTREELLARTTIDIGIYENSQLREELLQQLREQGHVRNWRMKARAKSGELRTVLLSLEPLVRGGEPCILATMIDITEREQWEAELREREAALQEYTEALRESEEKFHGAFNHAAIGFAMTTPDGRFIDANPAYCALTGYSIDELHAYGFDRLIHPDDYAENMALNQKMSAGEIKDFVIENRYIRKDGQAVWVRKSVSQVRRPDGAPKWNIALVENISQRKRAEMLLSERNLALEEAHEDLMNERNRLVAVMEALPVGLAIYDVKGGVILANPGFDAVWGTPRPPADSVDDYEPYQAWWVETGKRVQPEEWAAALAVQKGETAIGQYMEIQKFDGTRGFVLNSGAPVSDTRGQIIGAAVAIMDITERVQMEKALQESRDRFRVALSSAPLLVYTCDRDLRYTWVYNLQHGYTPADFLGKRDDEILPEEEVAVLMAVKQMALDTGQGGVHEIKLRLEGEDTYFILVTDPIKDALGQVTGLTCSSIEITLQKRLELDQQQNELKVEVQRRLMEQREQERQGIARDIHDGPIQTLSGTAFNLQILKESFPDPTLTVELNQIALNIKSAIRELREVVNDLRPPSIIRFGLSRAIQMHAEDLRERYPEIKIHLDLVDDIGRISEQVCLTVFRVFQEGLNNIIRHADASEVWVQYTIDEDAFTLEFRDNGKGFVVPRDFTGLTSAGHYGLAGMNERVEAIGGQFEVRSQPGQGTAITMRVSRMKRT